MIKRMLVVFASLLPLITLANPPLIASKAFIVHAQKLDPNTITVEWKIAKNYFLYKNCLQIINKDKKTTQLGTIIYPKSKMKTNKRGQQFPVYYNKVALNIPILSEQAGESYLEVRYQGCSDEGFCYPPEHKLIKVAFSADLEIQSALLENIESKAIKSTLVTQEGPRSTFFSPDFNKLFANSNFFLIVFSFLGLGLLLSFTPCILPMVPVLSGIIVGHGENITTKKAFFLSLTYVISMSLTYGIIGAVIAILGSNLQIIMQSASAIITVSIIFVLLALSMFDFYSITLPVNFQNKLANITKSHSGGHYLNAALLGSVSILVLSPCVSAPLIGALSYIAQTGDIVLGLSSLFFLSFGMGIPLLLIGTSAGKLLPKAGNWMNTVKHLFGILMLGISIYLLSRILPGFYSMLLWAILCIFSGVFVRPLLHAKSSQDKFKQGISILLISYGLLILYGATSGNVNPLQPLKNDYEKVDNNIKKIIVKTLPEAQNAINLAKKNQTPVVLYFYADWCASCHIISSTTLQDSEIIKQFEKTLLIKVDLTKNNQDSKILLNHFRVIAPPTFIFIDKEGNLLSSPQLVGEISASTLLDILHSL
jgi:thiol:disulfide interchange protein DsbD